MLDEAELIAAIEDICTRLELAITWDELDEVRQADEAAIMKLRAHVAATLAKKA